MNKSERNILRATPRTSLKTSASERSLTSTPLRRFRDSFRRSSSKKVLSSRDFSSTDLPDKLELAPSFSSSDSVTTTETPTNFVSSEDVAKVRSQDVTRKMTSSSDSSSTVSPISPCSSFEQGDVVVQGGSEEPTLLQAGPDGFDSRTEPPQVFDAQAPVPAVGSGSETLPVLVGESTQSLAHPEDVEASTETHEISDAGQDNLNNVSIDTAAPIEQVDQTVVTKLVEQEEVPLESSDVQTELLESKHADDTTTLNEEQDGEMDQQQGPMVSSETPSEPDVPNKASELDEIKPDAGQAEKPVLIVEPQDVDEVAALWDTDHGVVVQLKEQVVSLTKRIRNQQKLIKVLQVLLVLSLMTIVFLISPELQSWVQEMMRRAEVQPTSSVAMHPIVIPAETRRGFGNALKNFRWDRVPAVKFVTGRFKH